MTRYTIGIGFKQGEILKLVQSILIKLK